MKTITTTKMAMGFFVACVAVNALATDPTISDVVVRQRWPWSQLVDIDYVLTCDATQSVDVVLTAKDGSTTLTLPSESLSGDLNGVTHGMKRIIFDPFKTAYTNSQMLTQFSVTLAPTTPPVYMIVDLTKSAGADDQIEYIYPGDARLETYGRYTNVWFGVTNDSIYATDKLVLRRVHAGTFKMGDSVPPTISTTLTKEFYAGVFEVTQRQWELIAGTKPSYYNNSTCYASRPVEQVSYEDIRGASNSVPSINWPVTDRTVVTTNSFLGKLRAKTGLTDFDLPTEAQWECLCRAGTTTVFNDGNASANVSGANAYTNTWLDALGRYRFDGGFIDGITWPGGGVSPTNGAAIVGSYQANAWGLYDTHGNVWEWSLDWRAGSLMAGFDPMGAVSGSTRVLRGGSWNVTPSVCCSANRYGDTPSIRANSIGFRLVRTLP
jgi:formylglycine-generating enzyme required for sulfatase activity